MNKGRADILEKLDFVRSLALQAISMALFFTYLFGEQKKPEYLIAWAILEAITYAVSIASTAIYRHGEKP